MRSVSWAAFDHEVREGQSKALGLVGCTQRRMPAQDTGRRSIANHGFRGVTLKRIKYVCPRVGR